MNAITQGINLNIIPGAVPPRISVSQYDDASRTLVFQLYNGAVSFTPGSGVTAQIRGTKPDNKGFEYSATISGSTVTAAITEQMTAVAGDVRCEIVLKDSTKTIGTGNFVLEVERAALGEDTDISETVIPDIIDAAEHNAERAEAAAEVAESASLHPPYIGANDHWFTFDTVTEQYVDSGVDARGDDGTSIAGIEKTSTSGLVDTYTVTLTDGSTYTFTVTNGANGTDGQDGEDGVGIAYIEKTSTVGLVDTYTITLTDQTTYTFTVTNGTSAIPGGGTTGQVLTKLSNTSGDAGWQTPASGSSSLADLTDTTITNPADGEVLVYDGTAGKWVNDEIETVTSLSELTDTTISSPSDGQVLAYDAIAGKWENTMQSAGSLAGLTDTTITSPTAAQPLTYDATNSVWKNGGIIPAANGGTGNSSGYVRAGRKSNTSIGANATAEGYNTTASGDYSHAEGYNTKATLWGSHAEGDGSEATNNYAHAEGNGTTASGSASHSEGASTAAGGHYAHAEGIGTTASGSASHAEGYYTTASGDHSHAGGSSTVAGYANQFVCGKFNNNKSTTIFEVGIGANISSRANGLELDTSGNLKTAGTITDGNGNNLSALMSYLEQTVTLSTSVSTTVTFTDAKITTSSVIDLAVSEWGLTPDDVTVTTGVCTVTMPKVDSAHSVTVRIYVR